MYVRVDYVETLINDLSGLRRQKAVGELLATCCQEPVPFAWKLKRSTDYGIKGLRVSDCFKETYLARSEADLE